MYSVIALFPVYKFFLYACKPVMMFVCVFLLLLVTGPGSAQAQCRTSSGCTGDTVPADDARDCCVGTNHGQSYGVGPGNCEVEQCIGKSFIGHDTIALSSILF